jgi:hypothetical protein
MQHHFSFPDVRELVPAETAAGGADSTSSSSCDALVAFLAREPADVRRRVASALLDGLDAGPRPDA